MGMSSTLLPGMPVPARWAVVGATSVGVAGGVAGLVVGLIAYAPTAPFAVVELGVRSALVGGLAGLALSAVTAIRWATAAQRVRLDRPQQSEQAGSAFSPARGAYRTAISVPVDSESPELAFRDRSTATQR